MNIVDYYFENTHNLDKEFLVGKENVSFKEFFSYSSALALYLKEKYGEGNNMPILSPNNRFFIIVYLAIMKSGNIAIPLDPIIEQNNFDYITNLTNPPIVFIDKDVLRRQKINVKSCFSQEELENISISEEIKYECTPFDDSRCAEIIFTSGSTGTPKGVMLSHKNLRANTRSILEYLQLTSSDRILVVLPFYYCYGLSLLHTHLRVGGSIVLNNTFILLGGIINNLRDYKCTGFAGVPSHFQILLRNSDSFRTTKFPSLKYVTQAGGKLPPIFIDEFKASFPDVKFIVMYGQTEATARLSYLPAELYETKKASMGKGIPGVELKVIDGNGDFIKPGETGEVVAKGDNIMMGYFNDEETTKMTIKNGWLYTGDLGTIDEDGYIYLTARKKEIIKVGGKRISPKEIENIILQLPEVIDCTIEGVADDFWGEAIKATVTVRKDKWENANEDYFKSHCSKYLAIHKIPSIWEFKNQVNISATGKKIKKTNTNR